jgi:hypothetical protein
MVISLYKYWWLFRIRIAKFSIFWFCNLRIKSYFVLILEGYFNFATDSQIKKNFKSGSSDGGYFSITSWHSHEVV